MTSSAEKLTKEQMAKIRAAGEYDRYIWSKRHRLLKGNKPLRFDGRYAPCAKLYQDHHPHIVIRKANQVYGSEFAVSHALHLCDIGAWTGIYYFPTDGAASLFSTERIKPSVERIPHLRDKSKTDNVHQKLLGDSWFHVRGMWTKMSVEVVDADFLIFDELDQMKQDLRESAMERISASNLGYVVELSRPSIPKYGIDLQFMKGDQRYWLLKCGHCNTYTCQEDSFPGNIRTRKDGTYYRSCVKCGNEIFVSDGEWVAKKLGLAGIHSYQLSQLMSASPLATLQLIMHAWNTWRNKGSFYNRKIGVPYEGDRIPLTHTRLIACSEKYPLAMSGNHCTMGVDAHDDHLAVVISKDLEPGKEGKRIMWAGRIMRKSPTEDLFLKLDPKMKQYGIDMAVVDAGPDLNSARGFCGRHIGRALRCFYRDRQNDKMAIDEDEVKVTVHRTSTIDFANALWRDRDVVVPLELVEDPKGVFVEEMCNMAKLEQVDEETGDKIVRYTNRGPDHFRHADNYDNIARDVRAKIGTRGIVAAEYKTDSPQQQNQSTGLPPGWASVPDRFTGLPEGF